METFFAVLAAAAAALTLAAGVAGLFRWLRARRHRRQLRGHVDTLVAQAEGLGDVIVRLDHRMSEGVGWCGQNIWPDAIGPDVVTLEEITSDAEATAARLRGLAAEPALERLRSDVERAAGVVAHAAAVYRFGTIGNYRASSGKPIPPGAGGRDLTAALRFEDAVPIEEAQRSFTFLVRGCLYQLGDDDAAKAFRQWWPITRADIFDADPEWTPPTFPDGTDLHPPIGGW